MVLENVFVTWFFPSRGVSLRVLAEEARGVCVCVCGGGALVTVRTSLRRELWGKAALEVVVLEDQFMKDFVRSGYVEMV